LSNITLPYTDLISIARENFEDIHRTLPDKSCIFILTDFNARIIEIFSAPEVILRCNERGIVRGASLVVIYHRHRIIYGGGGDYG
ncbi:MAG: hypothetical protein HY279_00290, partial [Nitrospinae bacterium]|nr:hypothetical protein [Nitrospinota bacterium]